MSVVLKGSPFPDISPQELAEQIQAKKKCEKKLPTWFHTPKIHYPNKMNIEQCSSEITAEYKAQLVGGKTLVDLTGGLGVDAYFFSKKTSTVFHCEIDENLSEIAAYNFGILGADNVQVNPVDGMIFLQESNRKFDWLYLDPSRRSDNNNKVFLLSDCTPNITEHLSLLLNKANRILVKTSPLLDLTIGLKQLEHVKEIHIVAVNNEVKEVLWVLQGQKETKIRVKTINLMESKTQKFDFDLSEEKDTIAQLGWPLSYIYEPNAALLKSGAFKLITAKLAVQKLHEHSHLYTSNDLMEFPGRVFRIEKVLAYTKKELRSFVGTKANVAVRNFPESVSQIRKKYKIKDGGDVYLYFTRLKNDQLALIKASKKI
ncbi:MAG: class I SAM-dependent methyltransferase [Maribacter sp.]|uniref:THUMP-like domain-containing protein n=1 Tax=Maribacter sp. TaxID=1897614 RepID=UPI003C762A21